MATPVGSSSQSNTTLIQNLGSNALSLGCRAVSLLLTDWIRPASQTSFGSFGRWITSSSTIQKVVFEAFPETGASALCVYYGSKFVCRQVKNTCEEFTSDERDWQKVIGHAMLTAASGLFVANEVWHVYNRITSGMYSANAAVIPGSTTTLSPTAAPIPAPTTSFGQANSGSSSSTWSNVTLYSDQCPR
jgi:hypothetical protein